MLRIAEGTLAGIAAGMVVGAAARVAMRLVALGVADGIGITPEFTVAGTLMIMVSGAIAGAPLGAVYALIQDRLPGPARTRGLAYATLMLAFFGPLFLGNDEIFSTGRFVLFFSLFPIYGLGVGAAHPLARRIGPRLPRDAMRLLALFTLAGTGLVGFGIVSLAATEIEEHGAAALAFAIPWIAAAVFSAPAIRARVARLQAAR